MSSGFSRNDVQTKAFIPENSESSGTKLDMGKPPISLIPREFLEQVAMAFDYGAKKYGRHNFRKGIQVSRLLDAAMRHTIALANGETNDPESGLNHGAHAGASLAMALFMLANRPDLDDRYKPE